MTLVGCLGTAPKEGEQTTVQSKGALEGVTFTVSGGTDMGLFLIGADPVVKDAVVTNNSGLPITGVNVVLDDTISAGMTYNPTPEGLRSYPGYGGNCDGTLEVGESCTVKIYYSPQIQGVFSQLITFTYNDVLESKSQTVTLTLQAGEPASLIFADEVTTYSYGVLERKDCENIITQNLTIKNAGGLPATNMIFGLTNNSNMALPSDAFIIQSNSCPTSLAVGQTCNLVVTWQPQNWGDPKDCNGDTVPDVAPDGDEYSVSYSGQLTVDYQRDPLGGLSTLNGYFNATATTIEGRMEVSGLPEISFDDPFFVAGQSQKKTIKLTNFGYKEAIMRAIHVRQGGTTIATCIKDLPGTDMECRARVDPSDSANKLSKIDLPIRLDDINECFDLYTYMNYTRLPDGSLSVSDLKTVNGIPEGGVNGKSCFIDVYFEPSTSLYESGNFADPNDYEFVVEYDSTWKNLLDPILTLRGENPDTDDDSFQILEAQYKANGKLYWNRFRYAGTDIIDTDNKVIQYKTSRFNEKAANDGSIYNAIHLELLGDTFTWETSGADEILSEGTKFTVSNLPSGLTMQIKKVTKNFGLGDAEHAEISLIGNADNHGAANSISTIEIEFLDAAFTGGVAGNVLHARKGALQLTFFDSYMDFKPDLGDPTMDIFLDLGRIALVNSSNYIQSIAIDLKNSGEQPAIITNVVDGKGFPFSAAAYTNIDEGGKVYYQNFGYDTNTVAAGSAQASFVMGLNPFFYNNATTEYGLLHDSTGPLKTDRKKSVHITYTDGADINDDGTARRDQKINVHWNGILVKKGFLVFKDTGDTYNQIDRFPAGNTNYFDLELKNDGTGPVTFVKLRSGFDDLYDYATNHPLSFEDDPAVDNSTINYTACDGTGCVMDCYELIQGQAAAYPGLGSLDCTNNLGVDRRSCMNPNDTCIMKVRTQISNANVLSSPYSDEGTRDYVLQDEIGANPERNWEFDIQQAGTGKTISFEYLDGDYDGRTDEDVQDHGDIKVISGAGGLASGEYTYDVAFRKPAMVNPMSPLPLDSAVIRRQALTLPAITSDSDIADVTGVTVPVQYIRFSTATTEAVRSFESETFVPTVVTGADDTAYDYVFHGGTFPADGSTYNLSLVLTNPRILNAENLTIAFNGAPAQLTHSVGTHNGTSFSGNVTIDFDYTPVIAGENIFGELEYSYDNQQVIGGSTVTITKKIKIMVASSESALPTLSSQEQDSGLNPFGPNTNYTLKSNALSPNTNPAGSYKDIRGGAGVSHRYTLKNNSATEDMKNIKIFFKSSAGSGSIDPGGDGVSIDEPGTITACTDITLGPGDECQFDISYTAPDSGSPGSFDKFLFISYAIVDNQYINNHIRLTFEPADPAIVSAYDFPSMGPLGTRPVPGFFPEPYNYDKYGVSATGTHITVGTCSPMETKNKTIALRNSEVEKASLLRAYRCNKCVGLGGYCQDTTEQCHHDTDPDPQFNDTATFTSWHPAGAEDPVEVYRSTDNKMIVTADRECLYGPTGDPPGQGFSVGDGDICFIHVAWQMRKADFGKLTTDTQNAFKLQYYSSQLSRRPQDNFNMLFRAFVEPNPVTHISAGYGSVEADSTGSATFTFQPASGNNSNCGVIDNYRIYYTNTPSLLNNIWATSAPHVTVAATGSAQTVTIPGLQVGSFYYIRPVAERDFVGTTYISESNLDPLGLIVPPVGSFYDHDNGFLFDNYILPQGGAPEQHFYPSEAVAACDAEQYSLKKNGSTTKIDKQLIDENMWDHILTDSGFTGYAGGDPWLFPHWLNEPAIDIAPVFPGYDCNNASYNTPDNLKAYQKDGGCEANQTLPLLVGRNLLILPFKYNYIEPNGSYYGYARCWAPVSP